ncbi:hypothetical protein [Actinomadura decatromicini]|uniref:LPXTG cell wall anchor domain-containing protein n=1 Tax=Actinomadura decatromicini TaxID=2604572 RepID=A0A5D3FX72_9ACTN|nr:hypothetical protein [Actinomadura decatromicini]TYK52658.1 hypothetical protein FXF68_02510 [Actinomadura decatromicini]
MRFGKATVFGLVVGAMTVGLAAPAMADTGDVVVQPKQARPGDKVTVVGKKCVTDGEAGSLAFVGGAVPLNGAEEVDGRSGLATIKTDTVPGTYTVQVRCGGHRSVGEVVVLERKAPPKTQQPTTPPIHPTAKATPQGGPATGFGGGSGGSGGTALLAGGGVLLLGGFGLGALAVRRRGGAAA